MKRLITETRMEKLAKYERIANRYRELIKTPGSQVTPVIQAISEEMGVCKDTIYKARRIHRLHSRYIDRAEVVEFHDGLIARGMKSSDAKEETAKRFKCSEGYIYQIIKMSRI